MSYDVPLFDAPNTAAETVPIPVTTGTARFGDRQTSIDAASSMAGAHLASDQRRVLAALVANGGGGTVDDVARWVTDRERNCIARRITDLVKAGLVVDSGQVVTGSRGRGVTVWQVV